MKKRSSIFLFFKKERDWLNKDEKIEGFEWRGGTSRVTTGIQIWSEPFILEKRNGEKVRFLRACKIKDYIWYDQIPAPNFKQFLNSILQK